MSVWSTLAFLVISFPLFAQQGDLLLYMTFNGSYKDLSPYSQSSRFIGREEYVEDRFGNKCAAALFDGGSYISVDNSSSLSSPIDQLTISAWVFLGPENTRGLSRWVTICCKGVNAEETSASPQYRLQISPITASIGTGPVATVRFQHAMQLNRWHHVAMVLLNRNVTVYIDAREVVSYIIDRDLVSSNSPLHIGRDIPGADEYYSGRLDDLSIYGRALNKGEILDLFRFTAVDRGGNVSFCPPEPNVANPVTVYKVDTVFKDVVRIQREVVETIKRDTIRITQYVKDTLYKTVTNIEYDTILVYLRDTIAIPSVIRDTVVFPIRDTIVFHKMDTILRVVRDTVYVSQTDNQGIEDVDNWNSSILYQRTELAIGQTLRIPNLHFVADSSTIDKRSYITLMQLSSFLKQNPVVVLEIGGHTNTKPEHAYCDKLSFDRAKAVADFLVGQGVSTDQLEIKGYGKRQPIAPNDTHYKALQQLNQRVEIRVVQNK